VIDKLVLAIPNVVGARRFDEHFTSTRRSGAYHHTARGYQTDLAVVKLHRSAGVESVRVETNLAKVLLGHNARLLNITELRESARLLASHIEEVLDLRLPPVMKWDVAQAEYSYDWIVKEPSAYVLETCRLARQRTGSKRHVFAFSGADRGFTFAFGSKTRGGRIYDKQAELEEAILKARRGGRHKIVAFLSELRPLARGRLRVEAVVGRDEIGEWIGNRRPNLGQVLDDLGADPYGLIATKWRTLVPNWEPSTYVTAVSRIRNAYPPSRARSLIDAWVHMSLVGVQQYKGVTEVHSTTIKRTLDDLESVRATPGAVQPLEPIEIHRLYADW